MHMMADRNYLNYSNELMYYTGLNRQNIDVVKVLQKELYADFDKMREALNNTVFSVLYRNIVVFSPI